MATLPTSADDASDRPGAISEASAKGFTSPRRRRSNAAKDGWKRRRREGYRPRGRRVGHQRDQHLALSLSYRVQQVDRAEFARRFAQLREDQGVRVSERGLKTAWLEYVGCMAAYRAKGQDWLTTNSQRAEGLRSRGRPRCTRTVQRVHKTLHDMGLLHRHHVRRGGAIVGRRDCLRVTILSSFVTPPSAAAAMALRALIAAASPAGEDESSRTAPAAERARPPDGGGERGPAAPAGTQEREQRAGSRPRDVRETPAPLDGDRQRSFDGLWREARRAFREAQHDEQRE